MHADLKVGHWGPLIEPFEVVVKGNIPRRDNFDLCTLQSALELQLFVDSMVNINVRQKDLLVVLKATPSLIQNFKRVRACLRLCFVVGILCFHFTTCARCHCGQNPTLLRAGVSAVSNKPFRKRTCLGTGKKFSKYYFARCYAGHYISTEREFATMVGVARTSPQS